jgi:hypothetical protein
LPGGVKAGRLSVVGNACGAVGIEIEEGRVSKMAASRYRDPGGRVSAEERDPQAKTVRSGVVDDHAMAGWV